MTLGALVGLLDWQQAQTFAGLTELLDHQTMKESTNVIR